MSGAVTPRDELPVWIVLRWEPGSDRAWWREVRSDIQTVANGDHIWRAADAGDAFRQAVLDNPREELRTTSYRVLRYEGGATFNIGVNVEAREHTP